MPRARRAVPLPLALAAVLVSALAAGAGAAAADLAGDGGSDPAPRLVARKPVTAPPVLRPSPPEATDTHATPQARVPAASARHAPKPGSRAAGLVLDPSSGQVLASHRAGAPITPASASKLLVAAAALRALGPDARLTTEAVRITRPDQPPTIVLVGGGDPTLATPAADPGYPEPAQLGKLAREAAAAVRASGEQVVRVRFDATLFSGPETARSWKPEYVPNGHVAPVTALAVNAGRVRPGTGDRVDNPPRAAARAFARLLEQHGLRVQGEVRAKAAPPGAQQAAAVRSPPLAALVERMLTFSDNDLAEALGRHVALAEGEPPSFRGATDAVEQVLARRGLPLAGVDLYDCSGLSHRSTVTARALARVLDRAVSPEHPALRPVVTGLPVAGFSGTLAASYDDRPAAAAAGYVRAKTGTLTGVTSRAGLAYQPGQGMRVFAFLADRTRPGHLAPAAAPWDRLAARLATRGSG